MKIDYQWNRVVKRSLTNLTVLTVNGKDVGFIYKPTNSRTDHNAWRIHRGLGNDTEFLGHAWGKREAQRRLEDIFVSVCS
mgnify:CR=1 FL=1